MFDTPTRGALIQVWLDEADRADAELVRSIEETERSAPPDASLPPDLAALEPGIALAAVLAKINIDALSGHDRVTVMAAHQRMASHYQAQVYASMASVADAVAEELHKHGEDDFELVEDACSAEIRAALRLTRRAADNELSIARDFQTRLPAVWREFVSGRLDRRRANLILHRTDHLPTAQAREGGRTTPENAVIVDEFKQAWVHENIVKQDGVDYVYWTLGTTAMLTDPVPLEEVYLHGQRPYAIGYCAVEAHRPYP
ncbi:MAG: DUF222 domain-containing protein, partial [Acidimicrobiia bacterium]|nr:DUF222 domain-containing protein [Acidimicrobiia bacterium]